MKVKAYFASKQVSNPGMTVATVANRQADLPILVYMLFCQGDNLLV